MADYTVEELEQMLADKQLEDVNLLDDTTFDQFRSAIYNADDVEQEKIQSDGIVVGHILKSRSEDKQIAEQRHYINETENGAIVGRAIQNQTFITGSYSDSLTTPTLQILGSWPKDRTVLKG